MRILVLTSFRGGIASRCLPDLVASPHLDVAGVVVARGRTADVRRFFQRKLKKGRRIGLLGTLNGLRMRSWYRHPDPVDVIDLAESYGLEIHRPDLVNSDETLEIFRTLDVDLGLSLGNSYIQESVFSIPRHGMINIHCEVLPRFKGAQSVIWPLYEGITETGFTIHQISDRIDAGKILYREKYPITLHRSLRRTVRRNLAKTWLRVPPAMRYVCENYRQLLAEGTIQEGGRSYTTPSIGEFWTIMRNHRRLYREQQGP